MSGEAKVLWMIFLILLPYLGIFAYLLTQGGSMADRDAKAVEAAREHLRHTRPTFNFKQFHDQLLSQGSVALPRVVRRVYGEAMWTAVRHDLVQRTVDETA